MADITDIMKNAIDAGLTGTEYTDRILSYQSGNFQTQMENRRLIDGGVLNQIILYTTALMESKSAMGLIVAAPTAGACGGLPGACIGVANALDLTKDDITRAMLAGGIIGVFIAAHATFAAEVGGCQAECGAGSGMAAAALVPGRPEPRLITSEMVGRMRPGSVIVDLAAERGGNCELMEPGQQVVRHGVTILGPLHAAADVAVHASQMYSRNMESLVLHLVRDGALVLDLAVPITRACVVTHAGRVPGGAP